MKTFYSYKWYEFNLNVDCTKCGNNIVFQEFDGNPTCNECGNVNKFSWTTVLKEIGVMEVPEGRLENRKLLGSFTASANSHQVNNINCYHCKSEVIIPDNTDVKNFTCCACNQTLIFKEYPEFEDLVFYRYGVAPENKPEGIKPIAVRCVSCGAPLSVDPTKNNFMCSHCSTENILPTSMRYKVVLADVFIADRKARHPKLLAFEKDGKIVKQALRENGKESFTDAELDKVLINKKDDSDVYLQIINEFKYLPSDSVLNTLFNTSKNKIVIKQVGLRLQKSEEVIEARIFEINPKPPTNKQPAESHKSETKRKSIFKRPFFIILLIIFIITIFLMINSF